MNASDAGAARATEFGLVHLTPEQLAEFERAGAYAAQLLSRLPRDFGLDEEPAHRFRAGRESSADATRPGGAA